MTDIKVFLLHYRDGNAEDHIMVIAEKNKLCARVAASVHNSSIDEDGREHRNYAWLSRYTSCVELKSKTPRILFHKEGNVEFNYLKGKLV